MDRIAKFMRKLDRKRRDRVDLATAAIESGHLDGFDIRELEGFKNRYRVRLGSIRIIFQKIGVQHDIIDIGYRKDVYKRSLPSKELFEMKI